MTNLHTIIVDIPFTTDTVLDRVVTVMEKGALPIAEPQPSMIVPILEEPKLPRALTEPTLFPNRHARRAAARGKGRKGR